MTTTQHKADLINQHMPLTFFLVVDKEDNMVIASYTHAAKVFFMQHIGDQKCRLFVATIPPSITVDFTGRTIDSLRKELAIFLTEIID